MEMSLLVQIEKVSVFFIFINIQSCPPSSSPPFVQRHALTGGSNEGWSFCTPQTALNYTPVARPQQSTQYNGVPAGTAADAGIFLILILLISSRLDLTQLTPQGKVRMSVLPVHTHLCWKVQTEVQILPMLLMPNSTQHGKYCSVSTKIKKVKEEKITVVTRTVFTSIAMSPQPRPPTTHLPRLVHYVRCCYSCCIRIWLQSFFLSPDHIYFLESSPLTHSVLFYSRRA